MEKKKKVLKSQQCPKCDRRTVYHRSKTNDEVCISCGKIFKKEK